MKVGGYLVALFVRHDILDHFSIVIGQDSFMAETIQIVSERQTALLVLLVEPFDISAQSFGRLDVNGW